MPIANALSVYLQGILGGLGVLLGLLFLILPGLYVFARWYLASALLVRDGGGRRAAMQRSWDMLAVHWPAALGVGLIRSEERRVGREWVSMCRFWVSPFTIKKNNIKRICRQSRDKKFKTRNN